MNSQTNRPFKAAGSHEAHRPHQHGGGMISDQMVVMARNIIMEPQNGRKPTLFRMRQRARKLLKNARSNGVLESLVRQVVLSTGIASFLPEQYARYQPVLREGMVFMMSAMPLSRLAPKIVDQLMLSEEASFGERLFALIKDMPTLQKLGQVVCRSPGIDPVFKKELTNLENSLRTVGYAQIRPSLSREIEKNGSEPLIIPEKRILAEASVCAVVPARVEPGHSQKPVRAVLKIVKPRVHQNMASDLALLDRLMVFLDSHKKAWGLGDFNFSATLARVSTILANEIDLTLEQENLARACRHFSGSKTVRVPERLSVSTSGMTAMTRLDGQKITHIQHLSKKQRRKLAGALAESCILRPIQDIDEGGLFHGDPHGGNLAYVFKKGDPQIIFYDWGMLGHLSKLERFAMILLTLGLMGGSRRLVFYTADIITKGQLSESPGRRKTFKAIITQAMNMQGQGRGGILSAIEYLFEKFTREGVVFSADLMMYEKAVVTLKGVLFDVDPTFNRDRYMTRAAIVILMDDIVRFRIARLFLREAWSLYRHSLALFLDAQRVLFWFMKDLMRFTSSITL